MGGEARRDETRRTRPDSITRTKENLIRAPRETIPKLRLVGTRYTYIPMRMVPLASGSYFARATRGTARKNEVAKYPSGIPIIASLFGPRFVPSLKVPCRAIGRKRDLNRCFEPRVRRERRFQLFPSDSIYRRSILFYISWKFLCVIGDCEYIVW